MTSQGLATTQGYDVRTAVMESWDAFIAMVEVADLSADTRLDGWTVREIALHLGTWDGESSLTGAIATLGTDAVDTPTDPDAGNAATIAAHRDATDDEVLAALRASRDATQEFFDSDIAAKHGSDVVASQLGALPLLTLVHAGCYELAVHALDVAKAVDTHADPGLLAHGVAALADSTGCLSAREGIATTVQIVADDEGWEFTSASDGSWTMAPVSGKKKGARVSGSAKDVLQASAGRADPALLVARRRIHVHDLGALLKLAPIIDQVPGIPGARALKAAARGLDGVGSAIGSVFGRRDG